MGGWIMVSHRLYPIFPGEVLLTPCVAVYTHACRDGFPVLGYPLCNPPYLNCVPLGKKAAASPSLGIPSLSFALFYTCGPMSGARWNPQLDSQSGPVWSCLFLPPFPQGCAAVCIVHSKA